MWVPSLVVIEAMVTLHSEAPAGRTGAASRDQERGQQPSARNASTRSRNELGLLPTHDRSETATRDLLNENVSGADDLDGAIVATKAKGAVCLEPRETSRDNFI